MKQIIIIHGGSSFSSYDAYIHSLKSSELNYDRLKKSLKWRDWLADSMSDEDVLLPDFPNKHNAVYDEWKIYFEKLIPFFTDDVRLVGYSLGGMFLTKYLHETALTPPVRQLILIAPSYDDDSVEDLGSFRITSAEGLQRSASEIHIFHSEDDPVSPFSELTKLHKDIPSATVHTFTDRNHFFQPTFPELLEVLSQK